MRDGFQVNHRDQLATEPTNAPLLHDSRLFLLCLHAPKTHCLMLASLFNEKNFKLSHRSKWRTQGVQC